jgi:hypothetical protein
MFGYWALADYGRSFPRPLAWLALSVFIFYFGYALILAPLKQKVDPANRDFYDQAVWMSCCARSPHPACENERYAVECGGSELAHQANLDPIATLEIVACVSHKYPSCG